MPNIGEVWLDAAHYTDKDTGAPLPKYLLILGFHEQTQDIVYRLLTSRQNGKPVDPNCYHGIPYPGYFMGTPMPQGPLNLPTWLDLRIAKNIDPQDFENRVNTNVYSLIHTLTPDELCPLLSCAANSGEMGGFERQGIYNARGILNCTD